jgi:hypothetical protein
MNEDLKPFAFLRDDGGIYSKGKNIAAFHNAARPGDEWRIDGKRTAHG